MFVSSQDKGFQITFANGWTASVQWGPGNHCEAQDYAVLPYENGNFPSKPSTTAEVAAWFDRKQEWYSFGSDTVKGYLTANEVLAFLNKVSKFKPMEEVQS